jgi:diguanylate cyclase (GGDEF)-like protein
MRWIAMLLALSAFVYAGPLSADLLNLGSLLAMGLILWALIIRIIQRDLLALVCLLGSLLYLAGTATEILVTLVPVPVTPFALNAQLYGALTQVLFLGFALGAKTFRMRKQYEQMQHQYQKNLELSVAKRTRELEAVNRKLEEHAVTDALTGLYNRKELNRRMKELNPYLARKGGGTSEYVVSAAYLDLDNFKYYNDTYGHGYGDQLLKTAADTLRANTRQYDLLFRLGGDEFLVIMPEADLETSEQIVERIRNSFDAARASDISEDFVLTVSIGLASSGYQPGVTLEKLIESADSALLKAKAQGKNQIACY